MRLFRLLAIRILELSEVIYNQLHLLHLALVFALTSTPLRQGDYASLSGNSNRFMSAIAGRRAGQEADSSVLHAVVKKLIPLCLLSYMQIYLPLSLL